jgi:4-amino-4-deoxy-L-arabinose transferase-like glycosyltransferase
MNPFSHDLAYLLPSSMDWHFDPVMYSYMAYSLIEKGGFYNPSGEVSAWYTPGFPLALAVLYKVFGYSLWPVLMFQAFCITASFYILFQLCGELFNQSVAWILLALLVVNIRFTLLVGVALTEPLFFLIISALLRGVLAGIRRAEHPLGSCVLLGLMAGYGTLVRPVLLFPIAAIALVFFVSRIPLSRIAVFLLVASLPMAAWLGRNYLRFGRLVSSTGTDYWLTWEDWEAYRQCSFFGTYGMVFRTPQPPTAIREEAARRGETDFIYMERTSFLCRDAFLKWQNNNRRFYAWLVGWRFKSLLMPYTTHSKTLGKLINAVLWTLTILPGLLAVFFLYRERFYWVILLMVGALLVLPALYTVDQYLRYQLPAQLFLTIPAACFWYRCYRRIARCEIPTTISPAVC